MFRTITAKYPGTCRRCAGPIEAGSRMRYGGRGRTYHLAAECPAGSKVETERNAVARVEAAMRDTSPAAEWADEDSADRADRYYSARLGF